MIVQKEAYIDVSRIVVTLPPSPVCVSLFLMMVMLMMMLVMMMMIRGYVEPGGAEPIDGVTSNFDDNGWKPGRPILPWPVSPTIPKPLLTTTLGLGRRRHSE